MSLETAAAILGSDMGDDDLDMVIDYLLRGLDVSTLIQ